MDNIAQFKKTYFEECAELLGSAEARLMELNEGGTDPETVNAIFRAVHSIKGGAGAFGFTQLVRFSHVFETLMDAMRDGRVAISPEAVALLMRANDALADIVRAAQSGETLAENFGQDIAAQLEAMTANKGAVAAPAAAVAAEAPDAESHEERPQRYRIRFMPRTEMLRKANEPLLLVRELKSLGRLQASADLSRLPDLAAMNPEDAYLGWTFELESSAGIAAVRDVFEFVVDDCDLDIQVVGETAAATAAPAAAGAAAPTEEQAARESGRPAATALAPSTSIRVDIDKVDRLVNLVGELVITQAMVAQQGSVLAVEQFGALIQGLEHMAQHTRELQESVMAIRAQPVKSVFARMPRVVREIAASLGKDIKLVMTGENTEIDKTVIEQLGDPLTHMIRNAVDHGVETPDERAAAGKPRQGTIHLSAEHRGGRIVIEITDDGRGINRQKVLKKAQERGLVPAGITPSDEEIDNLIFAPGLSTADKVSNISGRGVGMDVVKRNLQSLGGRVSVDSKFGHGSRFVLSLPLTLAVLDGMIVAVGGESYVVPLTNIIESLRPRPQDVHALVDRGHVLAIRGEYAPLLFLHRLFGVADAITDPAKALVVMVETEGGSKVGLVVDELLGQQQVVIKSLETNYDPVEGIAAATILGNGRVALILDISALRRMAEHTRDTGGAATMAAASPELH